MLGDEDRFQEEFGVLINVLDLIPEDHILRRVDRVLKLKWLREDVRHLYSEDQGRPSIDPESALRLMLAGFLHGIVHDRKLLREAQVNIAIRWFAGYGLSEKLPHHSSLTRIRQRWGPEIFKEIFRKTVSMCVDAGLVDVETVHVDSTLIRANASVESLVDVYVDEISKENEEDDPPYGGGGMSSPRAEKRVKEKRSTSDPDASLARSSRRDRFKPRYKQHTAVDDKSGVVVDVDVTTGKTNEGPRLVGQLERVETATGVPPSRVTADAGYANSENYRILAERGVDAVIPVQPERDRGRGIPIRKFKYDAKHDVVRCPMRKTLRRSHRGRQGWNYAASTKDCRACKLKAQCVPPTGTRRKVLIIFGYVALLKARRRWRNRDDETRGHYRRHRWRVEGKHAEAKGQHGLGRAVRRGLGEVSIQVFMTAAAMNLKRMAALFMLILMNLSRIYRNLNDRYHRPIRNLASAA
jgi:transposase